MNKTKKIRVLMTLSYIAVLAVLALSTWAAKPAELVDNAFIAGSIIFFIKALPLLLFIPGLITGTSRAAAWLCYMTLIYFVFAVLFAFTKGGEFWGGMLTLAVSLTFIFAMLYTRGQKIEEAKAEIQS